MLHVLLGYVCLVTRCSRLVYFTYGPCCGSGQHSAVPARLYMCVVYLSVTGTLGVQWSPSDGQMVRKRNATRQCVRASAALNVL